MGHGGEPSSGAAAPQPFRGLPHSPRHALYPVPRPGMWENQLQLQTAHVLPASPPRAPGWERAVEGAGEALPQAHLAGQRGTQLRTPGCEAALRLRLRKGSRGAPRRPRVCTEPGRTPLGAELSGWAPSRAREASGRPPVVRACNSGQEQPGASARVLAPTVQGVLGGLRRPPGSQPPGRPWI